MCGCIVEAVYAEFVRPGYRRAGACAVHVPSQHPGIDGSARLDIVVWEGDSEDIVGVSDGALIIEVLWRWDLGYAGPGELDDHEENEGEKC